MDALAKVPLSRIGSRTPSVFFSRLEPGAKIPPHTGMLNCRLICHLPLIVPAGCWLRVGNERREWREGELLIFDDSIEHEASNPSAQADRADLRYLASGTIGFRAAEDFSDVRCDRPVPFGAQGVGPAFRDLSWGEFRRRRADGDFANYGTEVQIAEWRIAE
jgi:hypothetical protein